jgi:D-alanyl-D-alanine dipeptidase
MQDIGQIEQNNEPLVDLSSFNFILETVYFKQEFSPDKRMFLREGVAKKLDEIQKELKIYKFKIWDGFRPRQVQYNIYKNLWQTLRLQHKEWDLERMLAEVEIFIANPYGNDIIPPHSTGGAVDLTLTDLSGKELEMGTVFDYFGSESRADYYEKNNVNKTFCQNRRLLRQAMERGGFSQYDEEWWHYDYGNQPWAVKLNKKQILYEEAATPELR